jgi:hypothetical protein
MAVPLTRSICGPAGFDCRRSWREKDFARVALVDRNQIVPAVKPLGG